MAFKDQNQELHFVLFPLMAQGHMIPMVDISKVLAQHGVTVTIITTPQNASRFEPTLSRYSNQSGLQIQMLQLEYPSEQAGFPKGCDNIDLLPSLDSGHEFFSFSSLLLEPATKLLQSLTPKPSCIISDWMLPYTMAIAEKLQIPRISFLGTNCFFNVVIGNMRYLTPDNMNAETGRFLMPGLPHQIELSKAQLPRAMPQKLQHYQNQMVQAERKSHGLIVNSFEELEPDYAKELKKTRGGKVWCVGPVSLCNDNDLDKGQRGDKASINEHQCLKWLDSWEPNTVIYTCLGSICNLIPSQLIELGLGLESTKRPFIWVIRTGNISEELEKWIQEYEFEEKIKGRGILIKGWAPQMLILSHPSVGGFLTHCGWNSILEAICAGVPMVTWPLFADQMLNEKLVVQVLRIGVSVGVEVPVNWGEEEETGVLVKKEDVKEALEKLMDEGGGEAKERRLRLKDLAEMGKKAVGEGGSSYLNIKKLIQVVREKVGTSELN